MKARYVLLTAIFSLLSAQVSVSGFIKFDGYYDTHSMVAAREGHYALYPSDTDDNSQLNFVMFQSRFRFKTPALVIPVGNVTGLIEADFFGTTNGYENQVRLRHSMIKIQQENLSVIIGQYWTPLFNANVYPNTISFNTGVPFQPFARMPQIRVSYNASKSLSILGALTMQRDAFQEISGNETQMDAATPGSHIHVRLTTPILHAGVGLYHKVISPASEETLSSMVYTMYGKMVFPKMEIKGKWIYGQDLADHIMLGGYAAISDTINHTNRFENAITSSEWLDFSYTFSTMTIGWFWGYTENLGLETTVQNNEIVDFQSRGSNIKRVTRYSPRIQIQWENLQFATEFEYTSADYVDGMDAHLVPAGSIKTRLNCRSLFAAYLFF